MSNSHLPSPDGPWRSGDLMIRAATAERPPVVWRVVADAAWPHDRLPAELQHDECEAGV